MGEVWPVLPEEKTQRRNFGEMCDLHKVTCKRGYLRDNTAQGKDTSSKEGRGGVIKGAGKTKRPGKGQYEIPALKGRPRISKTEGTTTASHWKMVP